MAHRNDETRLIELNEIQALVINGGQGNDGQEETYPHKLGPCTRPIPVGQSDFTWEKTWDILSKLPR